MEENKAEASEDEREISLNETSLKRPLSVIEVIGGHGPWQFRLWIVFFMASLCNGTIVFSALFLPTQKYCSSKNSKGFQVHKASLSEINSTDADLPLMRSYIKDNASVFSENCTSTGCKTNTGFSGISSAKPLYEVECWNSQVEIFIKCTYMVACALSCVLVFFSSRRFGRRPLALVSCLFLVTSSLGTSWVDTPPVFLILRFVVSLGTFNIYLISAISLMEYVHKDFKLLYFFTGHLGWGMAHFLLPAMAWMAENWTSFHILLCANSIILSIFLWWGLESPSSYPREGEITRVRKALKYAAFINGYSTTDVDMISHNFTIRQESRDLGTLSNPKMKMQCVMYSSFLFLVSFTTSFLYFAVKWHPEWLKVSGNKINFSFLGTIEVAAALILLFLTCIVTIKYLWSCVSLMSSVLMIIIAYQRKEGKSASLLFIVTVFFVSASWTLLLARSFCHKISNVVAKFNLVSTAVAVLAGSLTASAVILKADNEDMLLTLAIPQFFFATITAIIPDDYFGRIQ